MQKIHIAIILMSFLVMSVFGGALSPGDRVNDFRLKDYNGKVHALSAYKDKAAIVIIFVSTRCPVSNAYNKRMEALYEEYSAKNVAFLGINSNRKEPPAEIRQHAQKHGLKFTILKDDNNVIADQFGATVTPEVFVLSKDLTVLYHGRIDDSQRPANVKRRDLRKTLDEILSGKELTHPETKAFGCSIKRIRR